MIKILNLYAGIGGNRSLWRDCSVTAIEHKKYIAQIYQKRFPQDKVLVQDVYEYLRNKNNDLNQYDFIWTSPPCQTHSQMMKFYQSKTQRMPIPRLDEIFGLILWLNRNYKNYYIIENVNPWYGVIKDDRLRPTAKIDRHFIWSNFHIENKKINVLGIKHGNLSQPGSTMRKKFDDFISDYALEDIKELLSQLPNKNQVVRNCVSPKIGKYILESAFSKRTNLDKLL